jgi:ABC-type glycerol-3-phosphate transport system substrate-binding protein
LIDGESYAITAKDAEKALASWIFVRWLLTPENQVRIIETTGSFPISGLVIELLNDYKNAHPVWADALKYLPMAQKIPKDPKWGLTKKVLADLSWKLIQFNSKREDIPVFFQDAQNLLAEIAK